MLRYARRIVILVVGMTVLLFGIALIVLPGPAFVVIPIGLAILATEFAWARRWLAFVRENAEKGVEKLNLGSFFEKSPFLRRFLPFIERNPLLRRLFFSQKNNSDNQKDAA